MKKYGFFIDGRWLDPRGGSCIRTRNPATGETLAVFPEGTAEDTVAAIEAAKKAFPMWKRCPAPKRAEILLRAAALMQERKDDLGSMVTREMGKVISEGRGEIQEAIDFLQYVSGEGRRLLGETAPSELPDKLCMTVRQPVGVVGCITPWNFPVAVPCWKIAAALVAGNTVVFKPASLTPLCGARLVEIFQEAGLPPGVMNMVVGPGETVGRAMVEHAGVRAVSFTGGVAAGRDVYVRAAGLLKRVGLELGSKNPMLVMDDADLELALDGVLFGAFGTAGQRCTATSRLILHERVYDEFLGRLLERVGALRLGDPLDPTVDVGPVASADQERKVLDYLDIGKAEGARLLCGGRKLSGAPYDAGFFLTPAVFEADHGMRITREEIFGPVLSVIRVSGYEQAVSVANDVEFGLSTSIYTRNVNLAMRAIQDLESGITYVNAPTIGAEVHLPFGGVKSTGAGTREAGTEAIREFTEIKTVFIDYSGRLQKAQIRQ